MKPFALLLAGVVLVAIGLGGTLFGSQRSPNDSHLLVAGISGLILAIGVTCLGFGAMRRGYHYRAVGSPPGDMGTAEAVHPAPASLGGD